MLGILDLHQFGCLLWLLDWQLTCAEVLVDVVEVLLFHFLDLEAFSHIFKFFNAFHVPVLGSRMELNLIYITDGVAGLD